MQPHIDEETGHAIIGTQERVLFNYSISPANPFFSVCHDFSAFWFDSLHVLLRINTVQDLLMIGDRFKYRFKFPVLAWIQKFSWKIARHKRVPYFNFHELRKGL